MSLTDRNNIFSFTGRLIFASAILFITSPIIFACSCGGYSATCDSFKRADAVFVGLVQRIQDKKAKDEEGKEYTAGQLAHIQIEKSFKGIDVPEVVFRTEGSSCDAVYKEGQRWLFYAYYDPKTKSWGIRACDRSRHIEDAADDLLYLQGLPKSGETTRLSGVLEHYEQDPEKGFTRVKNLIGAKVKITGEGKTYEVYTDKNGVYEIYGLPAGKYAVQPEIPVGLKVRFPMHYGAVDFSDSQNVKLVLSERSCASLSFVLSANNRIAGKVFGADGRVLPNVCLNLTPKEKSAARNWIFDCTDGEGGYELKEIPPGEYLIVLNSEGKISSDEPFPTAYYPGVFEKEKATLLTISQSTNLDDYDIHIPSQETRRTIQGVLQFADGRPAAKKFVEFRADKVKEGFDGEVHTATDDQGRFTLTVLEGLKGNLRGFMYTFEGEFVDCTQLDKLIRANGGRVPDVGTKPIPLEIMRDIQDIKLTFPFPYCKKAREN
jgi:hypothetical protein